MPDGTRPSRARATRAAAGWIDPFSRREIKRLVAEFGAPLLIVDCARVRAQYRNLARALPGVDLHYALKPMPHPAVVNTIVELGGWLDLATAGEVELVSKLGVDPARCIHTHPIKRDADIRAALARGVRVFVADNPDEVQKFEAYADQAELLLRVSFRSPGAVCDLSRKFGCDPEDLLALARLAKRVGVPVRGLSFHVGSQAKDPGKHVEAIEACAALIAEARREKLGAFDTLDIGGGFPIDYGERAPPIQRFCAPIRAALAGIEAVCAGGPAAGALGTLSARERFHWLVAPRSTSVQVSAVHTGRCGDPDAALESLMRRMVLPSAGET